MTQTVLHAASVGDDFRLSVVECGADPQATLLVTDADGLFGLAVDTVAMMQLSGIVPPLVVVGIGYPNAERWLDTINVRARDLTPTATPAFDQGGGADAFVEFLHNDVRSWLAVRHPAAADDVTFFGHSLGGLFGTNVMLTQPGVFDRYIISSPSLWWDDYLVFKQETVRADHFDDLATSAFFGIGGLETDDGRRLESTNLPVGHPAKAAATYLDMVDDMQRFIDQLKSRNYPNLELGSAVIPDEFHNTVPGIVLNRGLRHFWLHR